MTKKTKSNFFYLNSWDHLLWYIDPDKCKFYQCVFPNFTKKDFRSWVEECSENAVYCWNGVSKPEAGSTKWTYVTPNEYYHWLIFENQSDEKMFCLKYSDNIVQVYNNGNRAWHASRGL